jgi:hypothetical protein
MQPVTRYILTGDSGSELGGVPTIGPTALDAQRHRVEAEAHFATGKLNAALTARCVQATQLLPNTG